MMTVWRRKMDTGFEMNPQLARLIWQRLGVDETIGSVVPVEIGAGDLPYFQGLADAGMPGAPALLQVLKSAGTIEIWAH